MVFFPIFKILRIEFWLQKLLFVHSESRETSTLCIRCDLCTIDQSLFLFLIYFQFLFYFIKLYIYVSSKKFFVVFFVFLQLGQNLHKLL